MSSLAIYPILFSDAMNLQHDISFDQLTVLKHYLDVEIIMKRLDPLRAKKTFKRKKMGHTAVSAMSVYSSEFCINSLYLIFKNNIE